MLHRNYLEVGFSLPHHIESPVQNMVDHYPGILTGFTASLKGKDPRRIANAVLLTISLATAIALMGCKPEATNGLGTSILTPTPIEMTQKANPKPTVTLSNDCYNIPGDRADRLFPYKSNNICKIAFKIGSDTVSFWKLSNGNWLQTRYSAQTHHTTEKQNITPDTDGNYLYTDETTSAKYEIQTTSQTVYSLVQEPISEGNRLPSSSVQPPKPLPTSTRVPETYPTSASLSTAGGSSELRRLLDVACNSTVNVVEIREPQAGDNFIVCADYTDGKPKNEYGKTLVLDLDEVAKAIKDYGMNDGKLKLLVIKTEPLGSKGLGMYCPDHPDATACQHISMGPNPENQFIFLSNAQYATSSFGIEQDVYLTEVLNWELNTLRVAYAQGSSTRHEDLSKVPRPGTANVPYKFWRFE